MVRLPDGQVVREEDLLDAMSQISPGEGVASGGASSDHRGASEPVTPLWSSQQSRRSLGSTSAHGQSFAGDSGDGASGPENN